MLVKAATERSRRHQWSRDFEMHFHVIITIRFKRDQFTFEGPIHNNSSLVRYKYLLPSTREAVIGTSVDQDLWCHLLLLCCNELRRNEERYLRLWQSRSFRNIYALAKYTSRLISSTPDLPYIHISDQNNIKWLNFIGHTQHSVALEQYKSKPYIRSE